MITMAPPRPTRPAAAAPRPAESRFQLPPGPGAASVARARLRAAIRAWRLPIDPDVAVLLVSELVTNALTHGRVSGSARVAAPGQVTVCVHCSRTELRVEVHDGSADMPLPVSADDLLGPEADNSETGRGLMLVDALAAEWGFYKTPGGKAVYFTLTFKQDDNPTTT